MYQRLDDVACIGNLLGSVMLNFIKVRPIHELKI